MPPILDHALTRRTFNGLAGSVALAVALAPKPHKPRQPPPTTALPTFRLRQSSLRGGYYLRGGL